MNELDRLWIEWTEQLANARAAFASEYVVLESGHIVRQTPDAVYLAEGVTPPTDEPTNFLADHGYARIEPASIQGQIARGETGFHEGGSSGGGLPAAIRYLYGEGQYFNHPKFGHLWKPVDPANARGTGNPWGHPGESGGLFSNLPPGLSLIAIPFTAMLMPQLWGWAGEAAGAFTDFAAPAADVLSQGGGVMFDEFGGDVFLEEFYGGEVFADYGGGDVLFDELYNASDILADYGMFDDPLSAIDEFGNVIDNTGAIALDPAQTARLSVADIDDMEVGQAMQRATQAVNTGSGFDFTKLLKNAAGSVYKLVTGSNGQVAARPVRLPNGQYASIDPRTGRVIGTASPVTSLPYQLTGTQANSALKAMALPAALGVGALLLLKMR